MAPAIAAAEAALAAALGVLAALLIWTLMAPESAAPAGGPLRAAGAGPAAGAPAQDRSILWRADPFARGAGPVQQEEEAPETTLNLRLFGVVSGAGDTPGSAVIRTPDNRQNVFREGEEIIPGVSLDRVLPDRAIIVREGVQETLYFEGGPRPAAAAPDAAPAVSFTAEGLYDALQFESVVRGDRIVGLRVVRAVNPEVAAAAGVAEGDILMEIAGRPLVEVSDYPGLFEALRDADSVDIVVERAGVQIPLTVMLGTPQ